MARISGCRRWWRNAPELTCWRWRTDKSCGCATVWPTSCKSRRSLCQPMIEHAAYCVSHPAACEITMPLWQSIAQVGLSGRTQFPHLHLTVRHQGRVVDPFAFGAREGSCGDGVSLWSVRLRAAWAYRERVPMTSCGRYLDRTSASAQILTSVVLSPAEATRTSVCDFAAASAVEEVPVVPVRRAGDCLEWPRRGLQIGCPPEL